MGYVKISQKEKGNVVKSGQAEFSLTKNAVNAHFSIAKKT